MTRRDAFVGRAGNGKQRPRPTRRRHSPPPSPAADLTLSYRAISLSTWILLLCYVCWTLTALTREDGDIWPSASSQGHPEQQTLIRVSRADPRRRWVCVAASGHIRLRCRDSYRQANIQVSAPLLFLFQCVRDVSVSVCHHARVDHSEGAWYT